MPSSSPSNDPSGRTRRATIACTKCRNRKVKCVRVDNDPYSRAKCKRCTEKRFSCEYISVQDQEYQQDGGSPPAQNGYSSPEPNSDPSGSYLIGSGLPGYLPVDNYPYSNLSPPSEPFVDPSLLGSATPPPQGMPGIPSYGYPYGTLPPGNAYYSHGGFAQADPYHGRGNMTNTVTYSNYCYCASGYSCPLHAQSR
ncbi:hypothetical protein DL96DRAFT_1707640 [Flagelloscypha sp. PMI_526]|nr:hypothetical protein DL96DRAFT_1707640 [Flagelloscypha sp. PMI_526]